MDRSRRLCLIVVAGLCCAYTGGAENERFRQVLDQDDLVRLLSHQLEAVSAQRDTDAAPIRVAPPIPPRSELARELAAVSAADIDVASLPFFVDAVAVDPAGRETPDDDHDIVDEDLADIVETGETGGFEEGHVSEVDHVDPGAPALPPEPVTPLPEPVDTRAVNADVMQRLRELEREEALRAEAMAPALEADAGAAGALILPPADQYRPRRPIAEAMQQPVNVDFREMELANAVALLAHKAGINVIAGADLTGTVTANLRDVPLQQAMETVLRMNGLGMLEEEGIYRIVPYEEAIAARRETVMVTLESADAGEVQRNLEEMLIGSRMEGLVGVTANETANIIVISGPEGRLDDLVSFVQQMDVAPPVLPTVTEAIRLNYADPVEMQEMVTRILQRSGEGGVGGAGTAGTPRVAADPRAHHLVVTDVPIVVEQVRELVKQLDVPVKQVAMDAMVVDAVLGDSAETGVDWLMQAVRRQSQRQAVEPDGGEFEGNLQELGLATDLGIANPAGILNFAILSSDFDWRGVIQAEIRNENSRLISNPKLVALENTPARITIAQEIPYIELTETGEGGSQTSTEFKDIGTTLEVTPRVTHDNHIFVDIIAKESGTTGVFNGIPIEDKREIETSAMLRSGQTIFVGGLRKNDNDTTVRKVPVLGDIPMLNLLFRQNSRSENVNELLIFLNCEIIDPGKTLGPFEQSQYEEGLRAPAEVNAQVELFRDSLYPGEMRDPIWEGRRAE